MKPRVLFGPSRRVRIDTTAVFGGRILRRGLPILLWRNTVPQYVDRGWQRSGEVVLGYYHAAGYRWQGMIREPYPGGFEAYIWNPPLQEIESHTNHRPCFAGPQLDGRYTIHFWEMPVSIDHAITSVEGVLREAYRTPL